MASRWLRIGCRVRPGASLGMSVDARHHSAVRGVACGEAHVMLRQDPWADLVLATITSTEHTLEVAFGTHLGTSVACRVTIQRLDETESVETRRDENRAKTKWFGPRSAFNRGNTSVSANLELPSVPANQRMIDSIEGVLWLKSSGRLQRFRLNS